MGGWGPSRSPTQANHPQCLFHYSEGSNSVVLALSLHTHSTLLSEMAMSLISRGLSFSLKHIVSTAKKPCMSITRTKTILIQGTIESEEPFGYYHGEDDEHWVDWIQMGKYVSSSNAQDNYPYYRREYMKPKEKRYMRANRVLGKRSNKAVRGLVQFIDLKRDLKYV